MSDFNKLLKAIATGDKAGAAAPNTAMEKYLARLAGTYTGPLPEPRNEMEKYLLKIAERGMGVTLPELTNPATVEQILAGFEGIGENGEVLVGTMVSGGGAIAEVAAKDVNFYDFDGTRVYAYTLDEVAALTELPAGPEHEGLVFDGWNATLDEIKAFGGPLGVGALYATDDSNYHLHITMTTPGTFYLTFAYKGTIDWGDGSDPETVTPTADEPIMHQYASAGDYVIKLSDTVQLMPMYNQNSGDENIICGTAWWPCTALRRADLSNASSRIGTMGFHGVTGLRAVSMSSKAKFIGSRSFLGCSSLKWISLPPSANPTMGCFQDCSGLMEVTIPAGASISQDTFKGCYSVRRYNFLATTPPTLSSTDALTVLSGAIIQVPVGCAEVYKAATNWSTFADHIVEG